MGMRSFFFSVVVVGGIFHFDEIRGKVDAERDGL